MDNLLQVIKESPMHHLVDVMASDAIYNFGLLATTTSLALSAISLGISFRHSQQEREMSFQEHHDLPHGWRKLISSPVPASIILAAGVNVILFSKGAKELKKTW